MDQLQPNPKHAEGARLMTAESTKVYELAKELSMDSITLIEKLKGLGIEVKSHMSSLSEDNVKTARAHFTKSVKTTKTSTKKSVESGEKKATTVIRRRAKSSGEEGEVSAPQTEIPAEMQEVTEPQESVQAHAPEDEVAVVPAPTTETETTTAPSTTPRSTSRKTIHITHKAPQPVKETRPTTPPRVSPVSDESSSTGPLTGSGLKLPSLLGTMASGKPATKTSSIINIVKEEPRKPTVKPTVKVDPNTSRPQIRTQGTVTPAIVNLGKEAIDKMVEEEQTFKKKGVVGRPDREKEGVDVKLGDYRAKKELVFLPKKKKVPINKEIKRTEITTPSAHKRIIKIENGITVSVLAQRMGVKNNVMIQKLMSMGVMATLNKTLDMDTATLIASEYGFEIENVAFKEEEALKRIEDKPEDLMPRPPVVTVMGHVDHGKTSLLDAIRSANVAAGEAGGITQHIGAYTVDLDGKKITFIDTPGHEAFTTMRARGANVTDIVILVVAADDGVMPQTREAVDHARAANVPIIVAVNKIDKPGANPEKVIKGLAELNLIPEAWGGDTIFANVSAIKKTGIKELLESVLLQAEVLELKANPNCLGEGTVLEAKLDRSRGAVVNILIKRGTLHVGDSVVAGSFVGRARALMDDKGKQLKEVGPGFAAELLGLEGVPTAGDSFHAMASENEARELAQHRAEKIKAQEASKPSKMTLEELFSKTAQGEVKELPIVLKTDVVGSTEALRDSLSKLATEKVKVKLLHVSTGGISESDVMLANASNAIIIGFNVRPETKARALAEAEKIEIKCYSIIYELLDDVKKAMAGVLEKKAVEKYMGRAEVRNLFSIPKAGVIAGSAVIDGKVTRNSQVRVLRDNRVIYTGKLNSLKRFKDDAKEVLQGYECGIGIENFNDLKVGDLIEAFQIEMVVQDIGTAVGTNANAT